MKLSLIKRHSDSLTITIPITHAKVLNLFLALLLSSFAGLNDTDEEEEEVPKSTRLQRLIEWSKRLKNKRKNKKKKKNDVNDNPQMLIINGDEERTENREHLEDGDGEGEKEKDGRATITDTNNPESMVFT